jgi:hypothetical protein
LTAHQHERVRLCVGILLGEERRLDDCVAACEDLGARDDLRQEDLAALPHIAEVEHRDGHALLEDRLGVHPGVHEALCGAHAGVEVGHDQGSLQDLEVVRHAGSNVTGG